MDVVDVAAVAVPAEVVVVAVESLVKTVVIGGRVVAFCSLPVKISSALYLVSTKRSSSLLRAIISSSVGVSEGGSPSKR